MLGVSSGDGDRCGGGEVGAGQALGGEDLPGTAFVVEDPERVGVGLDEAGGEAEDAGEHLFELEGLDELARRLDEQHQPTLRRWRSDAGFGFQHMLALRERNSGGWALPRMLY
jgi:hypothetical protein